MQIDEIGQCDVDLRYVLKAYANQRAYEQTKRVEWPLVDNEEFKVELAQIAARYLGQPKAQTSEKTDVLCKALLDTEIYPLTRDIKDPTRAILKSFGPEATSALRSNRDGLGIGAWVVVVMLVLLGSLFMLASVFWLGALILGGALWMVVSREKRRSTAEKTVAEISVALREAQNRLILVRDEIARGGYDPHIIIGRLQSIEREGVQFPSIVYALLESRWIASGYVRKSSE